MSNKPRIAVVGGGIGGTTAAILLQRAGYDCHVYEQAPAHARVGAGINLAPNSTRIFRELGLAEKMNSAGIQPKLKFSREWDTGEVLFTVPVPELVKRYGAPFLAFHRGDLAEVLASALKPETLHYGKHLAGLDSTPGATRLSFTDGSSAEADLVVGADGVHSRVREILFGKLEPIYYGLVAYRAIFPTAKVAHLGIADNTKWWGPDRYFLIYYLSERRDEVYFVTGVPEKWESDDYSPKAANLDQMYAAFEGFHPEVQSVMRAATSASKWAMLERKPFSPWSKGPVVLIGDACHPTTPHLGQGAGMALEDAVMLARCLEQCGGGADHQRAFQLYEAARHERTSRVQHESHENEWTKKSMDHSWLYGYDVFTAPTGT